MDQLLITQIVVGSLEQEDLDLSEHAVVLDLTLSDDGAVGGDEDQLSLSVSDGLVMIRRIKFYKSLNAISYIYSFPYLYCIFTFLFASFGGYFRLKKVIFFGPVHRI